jgi:predicted nucleotidyltransferase component of viral defense system
MLQQMLSRYQISNDEDHHNAIREVMQEITLAGLYRGGFFAHAAFYGGTALRIFYGLDRYSEDLDFSLLRPQPNFKLEPYFKAVVDELSALGLATEITQKKKSNVTSIESAFLKSTTSTHLLLVDGGDSAGQKIKIKFEVDTDPPLGFNTTEQLLLQPFSFYLKCFSAADLYAGKMHALLYRNWKSRVKGRDWYDFEFYVKNHMQLNLQHLSIRAKQSGDIADDRVFTKDQFVDILRHKIDVLDIESAKLDIRRFIADERVLDIWSKQYFLTLVDRIQFVA